MAGHENEAEQVVAEVIVHCLLELRYGCRLFGFRFAPEFFVLSLGKLIPAQQVDGPVLRGGEPSARILRNTRCRPLLQRCHEDVVRQFFGCAQVPHHTRNRGDDPRRFDLPDRFNLKTAVGLPFEK
ncbi:MAG TPA: hypothetical protein VKV17_06835 [Bryobacteraceae bacterium]|nr:hypothetical protein [Bryobacteraceae bacterium]